MDCRTVFEWWVGVFVWRGILGEYIEGITPGNKKQSKQTN